jgi:integrase
LGRLTTFSLARRTGLCWRVEGSSRMKEWKAPLGRHTAASYFIAAGVNTKALCSIMGHASVTITLDRYGHLMPNGVAEAGERLDAWLARP